MTFMEQKLKCDVYIGKNLRRLAKNLDYPKKSSVQNYSAEIATLVALLMPNMKTVN